jgi:hypothetical protein
MTQLGSKFQTVRAAMVNTTSYAIYAYNYDDVKIKII